MFNKAIKLETKRLLMRPFTTDDKELIFNIMKDKEMFEYTPDEPWNSIENAEEFINLVLWLYDSEYETFKHFFAVNEKESGKMIGVCGVGGIDYDRSENEVFYHIGKDYWGKGYATEAAEAMLQYAFEQLDLSKIIGAVHPDNNASNRIMEKIGLKRTGTISGLDEGYAYFNGEHLYSMNTEDYRKKYNS
jgi:ribosomal-protein-alanine N-acetyltransferase